LLIAINSLEYSPKTYTMALTLPNWGSGRTHGRAGVGFDETVMAITAGVGVLSEIAITVWGMAPTKHQREIAMTTNTQMNEIRELSLDEIDQVTGAFKLSFGGISLNFSPERSGIAVTVEGKGGIAVSSGGITVVDGKGTITSGSWGDILGGGKK
jgi:hypothetical protein